MNKFQYSKVLQIGVNMEHISFQVIEFGSDAFFKMMDLRDTVLYKPIGLTRSIDNFDNEKNYANIAGFYDGRLCATASLVVKESEIKMQRVAIDKNFQGKGIGSAMLKYCEKYAEGHNVDTIYCHARSEAYAFYLKNGYSFEGDEFDEAGITHRMMKKNLRVNYES